MPPLLPVTKAVMLLCIGFYCLAVLVPPVHLTLELWSWSSGSFRPWQLLTHALTHANPAHLFFNMLGVYLLGLEVERHLGRTRFVLLLVMSTLTAGLTVLGVAAATGNYVTATGISGALFGMMLVLAMDFGDRVIMPIIPPIPMKMRTFVVAFGVIELMLGYEGANGAAHLGHLGGMVGAYALMLVWRRKRIRKIKG